MNSEVTNLNALFLEQLRDRYDAAKQQATAYPKLWAAITNSQLANLVNADIEANESHVKTLQAIFNSMNETPEGETCEGTQGLIHEANELLGYAEQGDVLDLAIAISIQHINHHDIAGYRSCQLFAQSLGKNDIAKQLANMLMDEKSTDKAIDDAIQTLI